MRIENSFIPVDGVGERTERTLWESGVTRWDAFDESVVGERRGERIREFIDTATDRLDDGDAAFFRRAFPDGAHWRCYENFREETCFLDIETTGLDQHRDDVTVVGLHSPGETETLVAGRDLTADHLQRRLDDAKLLVTFNGKRFDVPFLEHHFDVDLDRPHLDCMYTCNRLGLSGGLSAVESALGVEREHPDVGGREAVRLWHAHEAGEDGALERLIDYNQEDAANLVTVLDRAVERLTPDPLQDAGPVGADD